MDQVGPLAKYLLEAGTVISIALVLRKTAPKIDGLVLIGVVFLVAVALVFAVTFGGEGPTPAFRALPFMAHAVGLWGAAIASTHLADRNGGRTPPSADEVKAAAVASLKAELRALMGVMDPKVVEEAVKQVSKETSPAPSADEVSVAVARAAIKEAEQTKLDPAKK